MVKKIIGVQSWMAGQSQLWKFEWSLVASISSDVGRGPRLFRLADFDRKAEQQWRWSSYETRSPQRLSHGTRRARRVELSDDPPPRAFT